MTICHKNIQRSNKHRFQLYSKMNAMLQRHCAKYIYIVPDGLRELMSDISREVIRSQPEQIYTFIADYLDALMITRENARIAAKLVESITEIAEITVGALVRIGMSREEADQVVIIIQRHFRAYLARKKQMFHLQEEAEEDEQEEEDITQRILRDLHISLEKLEEMVVIIQQAWRKFKARKEREKQLLFGMVDWRIAARSAIMLYRRTGVTHYEANRAATLIKAAYKGYYTRRIMKYLLHKGLQQQQQDELPEVESYESETEGPRTAVSDTAPTGLSAFAGDYEELLGEFELESIFPPHTEATTVPDLTETSVMGEQQPVELESPIYEEEALPIEALPVEEQFEVIAGEGVETGLAAVVLDAAAPDASAAAAAESPAKEPEFVAEEEEVKTETYAASSTEPVSDTEATDTENATTTEGEMTDTTVE